MNWKNKKRLILYFFFKSQQILNLLVRKCISIKSILTERLHWEICAVSLAFTETDLTVGKNCTSKSIRSFCASDRLRSDHLFNFIPFHYFKCLLSPDGESKSLFGKQQTDLFKFLIGNCLIFLVEFDSFGSIIPTRWMYLCSRHLGWQYCNLQSVQMLFVFTFELCFKARLPLFCLF